MRIALLVSRDLAWSLALARRWAAGGDVVTLVLLDRAVAAAREGHVDAVELGAALAEGVAVAAEEAALRRRALGPDRLLDGVKVLDLDEVADLVVDGSDAVRWL